VTDNYSLEKSIWTEADFDQMGWHDATIYGIAFLNDTFELAFDIDYIFEWVRPVAPDPGFRFSVAPCTLVFTNVIELAVDLKPYAELSIDYLSRNAPGVPLNAQYIGQQIDWRWTMDCGAGTVTFRAAGYTLYVRQAPIHGGQAIPLDVRGGISFKRAYES
jgi:hypothetical protein